METGSDLSWIAIDFGNVINGFDYAPFITFLTDGRTDHFEPVAEHLLARGGLLAQFETGALSSNTFLDALHSDFCPDRSPAEIRRAFTGIFTDWPAARETVKSLSRNFEVAVISDTNEIHFETIVKPAVGAYVSLFVASHLVRLKKPDRRIYRVFLEQADAGAEQCAYFDDREENVEAALRVGIPAMVVAGPTGLRDACRELGLL